MITEFEFNKILDSLEKNEHLVDFCDTCQNCIECGDSIEFEFDDCDDYGNNWYVADCYSCDSKHRMFPILWKIVLEK